MALTRRSCVVALVGVLLVFAFPLHGWTIAIVEGALAVGIVTDLALAGSVRALQVSRDGDTARRLGEGARVVVTVTNGGHRAARGTLRDAWPPSARATPRRHALAVPAGERRRFVTQLDPSRRTELRAGQVSVRSVGPLGLAARQGNHTAGWSLRVLPAFASRRLLPEKLARLRMLDGRNAARTRGAGTEFDSLRDYVDGDEARSIDWRASARRAAVVVRTWRPERDRHVLLVLDTGRTSAARVGDAPRLDAALEAALLLGALASRAGDHVGVLAVDDRPRSSTSAAVGEPGRDALPALLSAMAGLQPRLVETDPQLLVAQVLRRAPQRCLVVLFTPLETAAISEGLLPVLGALTSRHVVLLAAVADPQMRAMTRRLDDATDVYGAAAAEQTLAGQRRTAALLRRRGVQVVEATPEHFAGAVADEYLALKAAGRL